MNGQCSDTAEISVKSNPKPNIKILPQSSQVFCEGDSVILKTEISGMYDKILWSTGDTSTTLTVNKSDTYTVVVENQYGCKDSASIDITVIPTFKATIQGKTSICLGDSTELFAEPIGLGYTYHWSTGDTTQSIIVNKSGFYSVTIAMNHKCFDSTVHEVKLNQIPQFSITGDHFICPGDYTKLTIDKDFQSYLWNTEDMTNEINVSIPGTYSVSVTDTNGCIGSETFEVKLYDIKLTGLSDLDFGSRQTGGSYLLNLTLKSESNAPIQIKSITAKNLSGIFNITTNPSLQNPLDVGSSIDVTVTFIPDLNKSYSDSLIVIIDSPCSTTYKSALSGTSKALTTIFIPDLTALVGTPDFCIPLMAKKDDNMQINDSLSFTAEIRYDATALVPNDNFPVESGDRVITLSGNNIKFINNEIELGNFCGDVLLANKDVTPLRITHFKWNNPNIDTIIQNGSLTIQGLCQRGIARIEMLLPIKMEIHPNPINQDAIINYHIPNDGNVKLSLFNQLGQEVNVIVNEYQKSGQYDYKFSSEYFQLNNGLYLMRLISGSKILTEKLFILK